MTTAAGLVTALALIEACAQDTVMVREPGRPHLSVSNIVREVHDDADGSATVWLTVEET